MLKKFFLMVAGSFVGSFFAIFFAMLCMFIFSISIILAIGESAPVDIADNSVLVLDLIDATFPERSVGGSADVLNVVQGSNSAVVGLDDVVKAMEYAKTDDHIKGVLIKCGGSCQGAPTSLRSVRNAVQDFKKSGKWVYAYANEGYNQGDYYVASAADSVFINPYGSLDLHGLSTIQPYFKDLLDKVGVEIQVVRVGTYKSAVEPYILNEMSEPDREQTQLYLTNIWAAIAGDIAKSRGMTTETLNTLVDSIVMTRPVDYLKQHKLVDKAYYRPQFEQKLKKQLDVDLTDDLNYVTIAQVASQSKKESDDDGVVAVVYAEGEIDGMVGSNGINSEELVDVITGLQYDDDVKALVLRVNSPGGSAFGSEQIWKALEDFKHSGKPFAVSMGDYAASGGYYISCGAQQIFADSTTITGSIGIFGLIPCAQELIENKLGVHIQSVSTNKDTDLYGGLPAQKLTPVQYQALQNYVNAGYELFTKRCADGRRMKIDAIKAIAEGRVWDGVSAKQLGLIDRFGSLQDAVNWVATKAGLASGKYRVDAYPEVEVNFWNAVMNMPTSHATTQLKREMGAFYKYYEQLNAMAGRSRVLCLMPTIEIK